MNSYVRYAFSYYKRRLFCFDIQGLFMRTALQLYIIKILRNHVTKQLIKMAKKQF